MTQISMNQVLELVAASAFDKPLPPTAQGGFERLRQEEEAALFQLLTEHRLSCLFWDALKTNGATGWVSPELGAALADKLRDEQLRRAAFDLAFLRATRALHAAQLPVIACKGIVLAQHYYPRRGLRRMHDLDLWLLSGERDKCVTTLFDVGFKERPEKSSDTSLNFINEEGAVIDLHVHMGLFQDRGFSLAELSEERYSPEYRVFVPEAMVAHLLTHLLGHAAFHGILLCWFVDIALVLRRHPIDPKRIQELLRPDGSWLVFLRLLRTFVGLGWLTDVWGLEREVSAARPIRWDALIRQRRLVTWSGVRGKVRLAKSLYYQTAEHAPYPQLVDWMWQPIDWLLEASPIAGPTGLLVPRAE